MSLNIRLEQPIVGWQYGSILFNKRAFAMIYNIKVDKLLNQIIVKVLILLLQVSFSSNAIYPLQYVHCVDVLLMDVV